MATNKEIRKENLRQLVQEIGSQTALGRKLGHNDGAFISQILGPKAGRNVGDDFARALEKACNKPRGWMDQEHGDRRAPVTGLPGSLTDTAIRMARFMDALPPEAREHLKALMEDLEPTITPPPKKKRR